MADFQSVVDIYTWYNDNFIAPFANDALCVLVGNKCDLEEDQEEEDQQDIRYRAKVTADRLLLDYDNLFEISAKTGEGFDELFEFLVQKLGVTAEEETTSGSLHRLHFKIDDRVSVCDKRGIAHYGTICWRGVKKRIGRRDGEICVEIQLVCSYN